MRMIDVHCHMFNNDVLTMSGKILLALGDLVSDLIDSGDYEHAENMMERINAFIEMSKKKPAQIADALLKQYDKGSIIVPLMYDMYYLTHDLEKDFNAQVDELLQRYDANKAPVRKRKTADSLRANLVGIGDKLKTVGVDQAIKDDSFDIQRKVLIALKNKQQFKDSVYPFMSFDPRRSGNLDMIKTYVGQDKEFRGVKLYTPLGFSAAHPLMMDKQNGLYAHCVANDIPITAHCSCPGMPTMNDHLNVPHDSWVYDNDQKNPVKVTMDKVEDFSRYDSSKRSEMKSQYFNHPELWRIVLDEFPCLRLNLAHFGGDHQDWRETINEMINSNKYQNLYTDISCRTDKKELTDIRAKYDASDTLKRRLMYGSDFTILLMYADLSSYCKGITAAFPPGQHQDVHFDNARRFLKLP